MAIHCQNQNLGWLVVLQYFTSESKMIVAIVRKTCRLVTRIIRADSKYRWVQSETLSLVMSDILKIFLLMASSQLVSQTALVAAGAPSIVSPGSVSSPG